MLLQIWLKKHGTMSPVFFFFVVVVFCICLHQRLLPQLLMAIKPPWMTCVQKNVCTVQCKPMRYLCSPTTVGAPHLTRKVNVHPHALELRALTLSRRSLALSNTPVLCRANGTNNYRTNSVTGYKVSGLHVPAKV